MSDKTKIVPAPKEPLYICEDDEGNKFVYVGEDTFTRLPLGEERDRWMRKLTENKVTFSELGGVVVFDAATGDTETSLFDSFDWATREGK